jgi:hypothetical protein
MHKTLLRLTLFDLLPQEISHFVMCIKNNVQFCGMVQLIVRTKLGFIHYPSISFEHVDVRDNMRRNGCDIEIAC